MKASAQAAFAAAGPIDVVYYLVHSISQPDFRDTDNHAAGNVAAAAKRFRASDASCTSAVRGRTTTNSPNT